MEQRQVKQTLTAMVAITDRIGFTKTTRLMFFLSDWAVAMKANQWEPITLEQFEKHARCSRPTAFRGQRLYRDVFPEQTPNERVLRARAAWIAEQQKQPKPNQLAAYVIDTANIV